MTFLISGSDGGTFPSWTTATRPASPAVGQMGYNTTTGLFDQYTAAGWSSISSSSGNVIQVVSAVLPTSFSTTSTTLQASGSSLSITPKFATSKILVLASVYSIVSNGSVGASYVYMRASVARGSTQLYEARLSTNAGVTTADIGANIPLLYLDSPATTSSTTYNIYISAVNQAFTATINSNTPSYMTLMEIAG